MIINIRNCCLNININFSIIFFKKLNCIMNSFINQNIFFNFFFHLQLNMPALGETYKPFLQRKCWLTLFIHRTIDLMMMLTITLKTIILTKTTNKNVQYLMTYLKLILPIKQLTFAIFLNFVFRLKIKYKYRVYFQKIFCVFLI